MEHAGRDPILPVAETERMERRIKREREARRAAEKLLEEKSMELYRANVRLQSFVSELESEVGKRTEELRLALARAQVATEQKTAFLATMSHEIRTPLNGVLGMSQLLSRSGLTPEQRQWVAALTSSGEILLTVINDVLDHTKAEAGKLKLDAHEFDLRECFDTTLGLFAPLAERKFLSLTLQWDAALPRMVFADRARLKQILGNLLSNAIKFTDRGRVTVAARLQATLEQRIVLGVEVVDTGSGIAETDLPKLFRAYSQLRQPSSKPVGGSGLGLAICAQLASAMGGDISAESKLGVGTTFRVSVMLQLLDAGFNGKPSAAMIAAMREAAIEDAALRGLSELTVVVAEDNDINALLIDGLLRKWVAHLEFAQDGAIAVAATERLCPQVVLMDVQMPNVDGIEATKLIRSLPLTKQPYIIGLTAGSSDADRVSCAAAGMDDFLPKPVSRDLLLLALLDVVRISERSSGVRASTT